MMATLALSIEKIVLAGGLFLAILFFSIFTLFVRRRLPSRLNVRRFRARWLELQKFCADKSTWPEAIAKADELLDNALKKKSFKGKTMGERLVNAQRLFSDNDAVWFAHKLHNKLQLHPKSRLKQEDVKEALLGVRQALKDLGAL